jgi:hypothetical protein
MQFEWDDHKASRNWRKHGVSFEVATEVFEDERYLLELDRVDEDGEQRWRAIGGLITRSGAVTVLVVVHVYREIDGGEGIIRIISAREADPSERRRYQAEEAD